MLTSKGFEVIGAMDGTDGIAAAEAEQPDMILLDINLPGMSGYEVAKHLKSCDDLCHIPIVAITADSSPLSRDNCLGAGCDDYLGKPILRNELLEVIKRNLGHVES